uniref:Uncharacterized protein n=1 Tax=Arundo donax TaxID=35708 RepID=A0A0A9ETI1_ARUDO
MTPKKKISLTHLKRRRREGEDKRRAERLQTLARGRSNGRRQVRARQRIRAIPFPSRRGNPVPLRPRIVPRFLPGSMALAAPGWL